MARAKKRRWIDPTTRDYVVENGGPRADETRASQVLLRLVTPKGSCGVLPNFGSLLHEIDRTGPGVKKRAEAHVLAANADLIDEELIRDVKVEVEVITSAGAALGIEVNFHDSADDQRTVRYTAPIGRISA